jgi:hypothetical protein
LPNAADWRIGWIAGTAQTDAASALKIKPSVSKIEKQPDMHLSTLRSYVEAVGGELELVVKLPQRPVLRLHQIGDVLRTASSIPQAQPAPTSSPSGFVITAPTQQDPERRGEGAALKIGR